MSTTAPDFGDHARLLLEIEQLRARIDEAEQILHAIRSGDVDAIVIAGPDGERVFTLSGAETVYRRVFETMAEAALSVAPDGCILFCNPCFAQLVETPMEQLVGRDLTEWIHPEGRAAFRDLLRQGQKEPVRRRVLFRAASGATKAAHLTAHALDQPGGLSLYLIATELTELESSAKHIQFLRGQQRALRARQTELRLARLQAEQAAADLRESEERLRFAMETSHIGAWELDLEDFSAKGSPEHDRIFGYEKPLPSWTYERFLAHVLPEDRARVDAMFREVVAVRGNWNYECRILRADGEVRWIWAAGRYHQADPGKPGRIIGIVQDITERKQIEEALRESEERFRLFMCNAPTVAWVKDEAGRYVYVSDSFERRFGIRCEDWLGKSDAECWPPEVAAKFRESDLAVLAQDRPLEIVEEIAHPDGGRCTWLNVKFPFRNSSGKRFVAGIGLDVTERVRAEEELRRSREDLDRAQEVGQIGSWRMDMRRNVLTWSDQTYRIFGVPKGTPQTYQTFLACVHPDDRRLTHARWKAALKGEAYDIEHRIVVNGEVKWVREKAYMEFNGSGELKGGFGITQDITERKRSEEWLRLTAQIFATTLEGIVITDADEKILEVNEAFTRITGYPRQEVVGKDPRLLKSGRHDRDFYISMWQAINSTGHWSGEMWNRRKDGAIYPELMTISAILDCKGAVTNYVSISSDITLLKEHEKRLERIAHYDALTGIPNRVLLLDRMRQALAQARREGNLVAVCYLDLDGFKPINDTLGHDAGDSVLIEISNRISHALRGGDTVARLGGDEFVVILLGNDSVGDCRSGLERLLAATAQPLLVEGQQFTVTASIGVTLYPSDAQDPDTLLRHADQAMYLAKQSGKNCYYIFDPQHDRRLRIHHEQKSRIEQGLRAREFELYYQPKVAMHSRELTGFEALIRWRHPERGLLPPAEFLPAVENSELEIRIGEWVIDTALKQMEQWREIGLELEISINIAAGHLQSDGFVERLCEQMDRHRGLKPGQFQIEILETAALVDTPAVNEIIEACSRLGVSLALDDFGTGYSSLAYLRKLPANTLKIDQSFVRDMLVDNGDYTIVQAVIALARAFGRATVAEGVETIEHFRVLEKMGCNMAQGYGIARPMPAREAIRWSRAFSPRFTRFLS